MVVPLVGSMVVLLVVAGLDGAVVVIGVVTGVVVVTSTHATIPTVTYNINDKKFRYYSLNHHIALLLNATIIIFIKKTVSHHQLIILRASRKIN
jgi:hypothetical protein